MIFCTTLNFAGNVKKPNTFCNCYTNRRLVARTSRTACPFVELLVWQSYEKVPVELTSIPAHQALSLLSVNFQELYINWWQLVRLSDWKAADATGFYCTAAGATERLSCSWCDWATEQQLMQLVFTGMQLVRLSDWKVAGATGVYCALAGATEWLRNSWCDWCFLYSSWCDWATEKQLVRLVFTV